MSELNPTDAELARRMLRGDERAFEEFFEGHFSRLFRFALTRLGGNADAAEEAAQSALCQAVSRLSTYRGEASLFTWLCTICRHEIARRRRSNEPVLISALPEDEDGCRAALESLAASSGAGGGTTGTGDDPEAILQKQEVARLVQVTLDSLPWRYASALEWKYLRDLPVREIAERLDLSLKAADSLLVRARAAFRDGFTSVAGTRWNVRTSGG